ncbi:predicted protein [Lichtheimia corymbifera JMRC:FSU:9682]|uniref:Uncharacterized protein n=1 Tax=Lichtheimia corymbifera JMRC:FSU:9682 TaxID=1263082 RepID=A0A068RGV9_9FUNG|nr:predicted protein [Lichtheimia corymbifera JMRC:FSU:9682]
MFTSKKRYSLYTIHLPLDSPANALNEIKQALTPTKRVIVDILLGTDDMFNKYNGTASIVLQGENSIIVNLYGKNYTFGPVKDIKGYLYCEHCKFINDHDTNECPDQPQAEEQPDAEEQPKDEKQPEEEFEEIDNNSISNDSTQKITRL